MIPQPGLPEGVLTIFKRKPSGSLDQGVPPWFWGSPVSQLWFPKLHFEISNGHNWGAIWPHRDETLSSDTAMMRRNFLGSFWNSFGVDLGLFCAHFGIIFGSCWEHFWIILGSFWDHFGDILGSFWGHFGIIFGVILGSNPFSPFPLQRLKHYLGAQAFVWGFAGTIGKSGNF